MKVLFVGIFHKRFIKEYLDKSLKCVTFTNVELKWSSFKRLIEKESRIIHFFFSPIVSPKYMVMIPLLKIFFRKIIIVHWVGSDVFALKNPLRRFIARFLYRFIDLNFTVAPWLKRELESYGLDSKVLPILPLNIENYVKCKVKIFNVGRNALLAYLPKHEFEFYGGKIVLHLANVFRDVNFIIVGNDGENLPKYENIKYLGYVEHEDLMRLLPEIRAYIRINKHDGLPSLIFEALCMGRYVITNLPIPHTKRANSLNQIKRYMRELTRVKTANVEGHEYVVRLIKKLREVWLSLYRSLIGEAKLNC